MKYKKHHERKYNSEFIISTNKEIERLQDEVKRLQGLKVEEDSDYQKKALDKLISKIKKIIGYLEGYKILAS